jgi:hypothetical protein
MTKVAIARDKVPIAAAKGAMSLTLPGSAGDKEAQRHAFQETRGDSVGVFPAKVPSRHDELGARDDLPSRAHSKPTIRHDLPGNP